MQCTHGNCRDFTLKRRRSRSVGAPGGFLMLMRCGMLAALRTPRPVFCLGHALHRNYMAMR